MKARLTGAGAGRAPRLQQPRRGTDDQRRPPGWRDVPRGVNYGDSGSTLSTGWNVGASAPGGLRVSRFGVQLDVGIQRQHHQRRTIRRDQRLAGWHRAPVPVPPDHVTDPAVRAAGRGHRLLAGQQRERAGAGVLRFGRRGPATGPDRAVCRGAVPERADPGTEPEHGAADVRGAGISWGTGRKRERENGNREQGSGYMLRRYWPPTS